MRRINLAFFYLALSIAAWAGSASIVPGVSIGEVKIGMARDVVHKILGVPKSSRTAEEGNGVPRDTWEEGKGENYLFVYYANNKVIQIYITSTRYSTEEGISTKSSFSEIKKHFKGLKKIKAILDEGEAYWHDATDRGIAFYVGSSGDGASGDEVAIAVHAPGKKVIVF